MTKTVFNISTPRHSGMLLAGIHIPGKKNPNHGYRHSPMYDGMGFVEFSFSLNNVSFQFANRL